MRYLVASILLTAISSTPTHAQLNQGVTAQPDATAPARITLAQAMTPGKLINELAEQGYKVISTSRTFLGRIRIKAKKGDLVREVVLARSTGEVLSDRVFSKSDPNRWVDNREGDAQEQNHASDKDAEEEGVSASADAGDGLTDADDVGIGAIEAQ